ncbi:hypothetical protein BAUCODRAFT_331922 [Baudoinia panamericana UAMH 10762]|uniref:Uncharacterized protein n=1 Tax=Baudoinia panamericana (strain UAMH 10762) TaxID=717646 RepID=M2MWH5_BAUPA|nr:uncharacterized protein BAUCODRAFT_331922 [Baudoinia panamericana UAMH 10762]EMC90934.1 hypothetical protein BAUCODRAFT_331922 [Baudoinia panamericana UAMH 10762]
MWVIGPLERRKESTAHAISCAGRVNGGHHPGCMAETVQGNRTDHCDGRFLPRS